VTEGVRENGEEANERGEGFPEGSQVYKQARWARSMVVCLGRDWTAVVVLLGGVVV
jgi:hypothetical protein